MHVTYMFLFKACNQYNYSLKFAIEKEKNVAVFFGFFFLFIEVTEITTYEMPANSITIIISETTS